MIRPVIGGVGFVIIPKSSTTGAFLFGAGTPAGGSGNVGDAYLDTTNKILYQKTGIATWTIIMYGASNVTPTEATFVTASGDRKATLGV